MSPVPQPMAQPMGVPPDPSLGGMPQESQSQLGQGQELGEGAGGDIIEMAQGYAAQISQLPPDQQGMALQALEAQSPQLAQLVQQYLNQNSGGAGGAEGVDMRPLPEKLPPRRDAPPV